MLDKRRGKAYREILAGVQYHQGEKLSLVTFGFKRGSVIDCRTLLKQISTWILREFDFRIDYFRVEVWENKQGESDWRVHVHMIWNAPYIKQRRIVEKVEAYIGENAHVDIRLLQGDPKSSARYLMQYLGNQNGDVYYTKSRGWLPKGYNDQWNALKHDFFEKVRGVAYTGCKCDQDVVDLMSHNDDTWRFEGLVKMMNDWVERKAIKRNYDHEEGMRVQYDV
jgi:hypothetical protein